MVGKLANRGPDAHFPDRRSAQENLGLINPAAGLFREFSGLAHSPQQQVCVNEVESPSPACQRSSAGKVLMHHALHKAEIDTAAIPRHERESQARVATGRAETVFRVTGRSRAARSNAGCAAVSLSVEKAIDSPVLERIQEAPGASPCQSPAFRPVRALDRWTTTSFASMPPKNTPLEASPCPPAVHLKARESWSWTSER